MKLDITSKEQLLLRLAIVNSMRNITEARDRAIHRYGDDSSTVANFCNELIDLEKLYHKLCE